MARARACLGVRFRAQGRDAQTGLDCIGLVATALGIGGAQARYLLRGGSLDRLERELARHGLARVAAAWVGDVLILRAGPEQLHLAIWTGRGIVHADAGLRRVVERPGEAPWPILGRWRLGGERG